MTKAVDVFIPIFELVAIVLCAGIIFILINFSTKMVKDKMHDIGILKALGCKNSTIGIIFGLQLLLIALCTIILSTIGYFFFIDLANDVLIESLKILAPSHIVLDLDFLTFKINVVGVNSLLVILLTIVSFIIPMLKIHNIKPVQIIKTKE
jgi:ABC-type lipoprotein release transport system permease subunit